MVARLQPVMAMTCRIPASFFAPKSLTVISIPLSFMSWDIGSGSLPERRRVNSNFSKASP